MKLISGRWLALALLVIASAEALHAGQIYGTIVLDGQGVKDAIEIQCGKEDPVTGDHRGRRILPDQRAAAGTVHAGAALV